MEKMLEFSTVVFTYITSIFSDQAAD